MLNLLLKCYMRKHQIRHCCTYC